jgi:hypothetical protein
MKYLNLIVIIFLFSCTKEVRVIKGSSNNPITTQPVVTIPPIVILNTKLVFTVSSLDSISNTNKNSSWYQTNKAFDELFDHMRTPFRGFQSTSNGFIPFSIANTANYWNDYGMYFYYDFNKDGKKDVWSYSYKAPWPSNQRGLSIFSEYIKDPLSLNVELSLTSVRKAVISDVNNDGYKEIIMFSQGYDASPFPGDSIGIFYPKDNKYEYLSEDIGFFHGGAVGDVNNDGFSDIVTFGLPHDKNNIPTIYLNKGGKFSKSNSSQINFPLDGKGGYPTIELYDIENDGFLDMVLGSTGTIKIIKNTNGVFDYNNFISIKTNGLPLSFIFYDFNKDNKVDILSTNTYDYQGYNLNLYNSDNNNFNDETLKYFDAVDEKSQYTWIKLIRLFDYDKDGDLDVVGDGLFGSLINKKIHWNNNEGKFKRVIN